MKFMSPLILGFVPLLDCATLAAAHEQGFAHAEGLELTLVRENSWANIRDRVIVGHFHAAHMLGPMTIASALGIGHMTVPMIAAMSLGLGGNAITVSKGLWRDMTACGASLGASAAVQGKALREAIDVRAARGLEPLTFAMVYPFSAHNYELRYWLAACGIDPDLDVRLTVIPPPFLVDALREGQIDGFCVGAPWSSLAVEAGVGTIVLPTTAIWKLSPEKVLGCRAEWADQHADELAALIRALTRAAQWCDDPNNHAELAKLLSEPRYIGVSAEVLQRTLAGTLRLSPESATTRIPDYMFFARHSANFPWRSHASWFYSQMVRWKQIEASHEKAEIARSAYRPDLYRNAVQPLGIDVPLADAKIERTTDAISDPNSGEILFGAEGFFDGRVFDPEEVDAYIAGL
jgi:NitT/TauT family transport system ATP-binding protein